MVIIMNIAYISNQVKANNLTYEAIIKVASIYHAHGKYQFAMNELSRFAEDVPKHYRASLILATSIVATKSSYKLLEVIFDKMKVKLK
jgi:regulator of sirC expression with transglutaminase-like and TPR domain